MVFDNHQRRPVPCRPSHEILVLSLCSTLWIHWYRCDTRMLLGVKIIRVWGFHYDCLTFTFWSQSVKSWDYATLAMIWLKAPWSEMRDTVLMDVKMRYRGTHSIFVTFALHPVGNLTIAKSDFSDKVLTWLLFGFLCLLRKKRVKKQTSCNIRKIVTQYQRAA